MSNAVIQNLEKIRPSLTLGSSKRCLAVFGDGRRALNASAQNFRIWRTELKCAWSYGC